MFAVTEKRIQKNIKELEFLGKSVRRKLFELRTLASMREIQQGKFEVFESAKDLMDSVRKK